MTGTVDGTDALGAGSVAAPTATGDDDPTTAIRRGRRATGPSGEPRDQQGRRQISQVPYLPGLDGMRALAVVAVMVYHANSSWLPGGYLGVEVFFVISGYLITLLIIAEWERTGTLDLKSFWIRRARRLLPALFLMLLLLTVWVALFERDALGKLRGDVLGGIFYISNWYQIWIGAGYSAGNDFAPLRHLWSLAVEEQFYLLWPLVMTLFMRSGTRRIADMARWLFLGSVVLYVAIALVSYGGPQQTPEFTPDAYWEIGGRFISKPDALYLSTITRAGGLMLGSAFAMIWRPTAIMRSPLRDRGRLFDGLALVGFLALAAMCWYVSFKPAEGVHGFLFNGGLFVADIATIAVIAAITHRGAVTGRLLSNPVLLWIGTRSYGLYLYHWPIYQIIRNIAANKLQFHEFVLAMVATCIITELSYRFVETPIRKGQFHHLWTNRRRSGITPGQRKGLVGAAIVATGLTVFAGVSLATAPLKQNEVAQSLDAGEASTCNVLEEDCFGTQTTVADGDPATASTDPAGAGTETTVAGEGDPGTETTVADGTETTVTPTTEAVAAAPTRLAVGDSVMLGAAGPLADDGFVVDAIESRAFVNGLDAIENLAAAGQLPDQLVIHLGTNGPISQSEMDRMMAAVAGVPQVVLVQNDLDPGEYDYVDDNNILMVQAADQYVNVSVLYWPGLVASCPGDCVYDDGIHLKPDGAQYYAELITNLLDTA